MTESELDSVYTQLCRTMTNLGQANGPLFLARFALLAIDRLDDAALARELISEAGTGMPGTAPQAGK